MGKIDNEYLIEILENLLKETQAVGDSTPDDIAFEITMTEENLKYFAEAFNKIVSETGVGSERFSITVSFGDVSFDAVNLTELFVWRSKITFRNSAIPHRYFLHFETSDTEGDIKLTAFTKAVISVLTKSPKDTDLYFEFFSPSKTDFAVLALLDVPKVKEWLIDYYRRREGKA